MAKIKFTALVNSMSGRLGGSVFSARKGVSYLKRHSFTQRQPNTSEQQNSRGFLNNLSGLWYSLPATKKELWESYASMRPGSLSGFNAHNGLNLPLLKYLGVSSYISSPPPEPGTPAFPQDFTITNIADTGLTASWTRPESANVFLILQYWLMPGRQDAVTQRWQFGFSCASDVLHKDFNLLLPPTVSVKFRVRTLDNSGRLSPWLHRVSASTSGPANYGWGVYGVDFYNNL